MFGDCDACPEKPFSKRKEGHLFKAFGGFAMSLCTDCIHEWHEFCVAQVGYKRDREIHFELARLDVAVYALPRSAEGGAWLQSEHDRLNRELASISDAAYVVAKAWADARRLVKEEVK